jgi:phosphate transport system protein
MNQYIDEKPHSEIEEIRNQLLCMGDLVEQKIDLAMKTFGSGDFKVAKKGINLINQIENLKDSLDKGCLDILTLHHPTGFDLRFFVTVIKITHELNLIGVLAECISKKSIQLTNITDTTVIYPHIQHLSQSVQDMLRCTLNTFAEISNTPTAPLKLTKEPDGKYADISLQLTTKMMQDPHNITRNIQTLRIVRKLERIGDHALHIYKELIYMMEEDGDCSARLKLVSDFSGGLSQ